MKVRKTVSAILISVLLVCIVLLCAVAANSSRLTEDLIVSFLTSYNSESPSFIISYDTISPSVSSGIKLEGLCVGNGNDVFFSVSEVNVSAGILDVLRMIIGTNPKAVEVSVNGARFLANEAFLESVGNISENSSSKKKSDVSFSMPFTVEITLENLWADVDIPACDCSIGKINAFARLDKTGLAIGNVNIPFISAMTPAGGVIAKDIRLAIDRSYKTTLSVEKLSLDDNVEVSDVSGLLTFNNEGIDVSIQLPSAYAYGATAYNSSVVASLSNKGILADLLTNKVVYNLSNSPIDRAWIDDLGLSASWNREEGLKAKGSAGLYCSSELGVIKNLSSDVELFADIPDFEDVVYSSVFCVKLNKIVCPVLDGKNSLEAYLYNLNDVRISGSLYEGLDIGASFDISDLDGIATLSLTDLVPETVDKPVSEFAPKMKSLFVDGTKLNGQVLAEFAIKDKWIDADIDAGIDLSDVLFLSGLRNGHANIKASSVDGVVGFEQFEVQADEYYAEFDGSIDLSWLGIDGYMSIVNQTENKSLASFDFTPTSEHSYHLEVLSEHFDNYALETDFTFLEKGKFDVSSVLVTEFADYPVNVAIEALSDLALTVSDSNNNVDIVLKRDKTVAFDSNFGGFEFWVDNENSILLSGRVSGIVNTTNLLFDVDFDKVNISYSELVRGTVDMTVTNTTVDVYSMSLYVLDAKLPIEGTVSASFRDIKNLASIDLKGIKNLKRSSIEKIDSTGLVIKADFGTKTGDKCRISYKNRLLMADVESNYLDIPIKINAMGSLKDVLYADVSFGQMYFELSYSEEKARIYKAKGKIGSFDIAGLEATVDTQKHTMTGFVNLILTLKNHTGDVTSKADIEFDAELISLGDILKGKLFSSSEYELVLKIRNAQISDTLPLADTDVSLRYSNALITASGNLINGKLNLLDGYAELSISPEFLFGFDLKGYISDEVDLSMTNISFPIEIINPLINVPVVNFLDGDFTGSLMLHGPIDDVMFYGMLYCNSFEMEVFYLPDQKITVKNIAIIANENTISMPECPIVGYSNTNNGTFTGTAKLEAIFQNTKFESFEVTVSCGRTPFDFWLPLKLGAVHLNLGGDVYDGEVKIGLDSTAKLSITGQAHAENFIGSFVFPDNMPAWFFEGGSAPILDLTVITGKDVEVYYPDVEDSLVNLTCKEDEKVRIMIDRYGHFSSEGDFEVKTGRVYYFNNDFYVTDGHMYLEDNPLFGNGFQIYLDIGAKTRQYDSNGDPLDIYLSVNNATFDNMTMRFSSSSSLTENEIIQILGQAVLPTSEGVSLASVASFAYSATEAVQKLNLVESNENFSITETLRDALGLDFLSARSPLLANILLDTLPGEDSGISLLSKYLNGTSVFAGKYFGNNIFARVILLLESDTSARNTSHFLANDLSLDVEFSFEWDNPLATFTVFAKPQELSVFGFLDTIGLTVSKTLRY